MTAQPVKIEAQTATGNMSALTDVSADLVTLKAPLSAGAEAIRALRTHVLAQHIHAGRRGLAICAASQGVGCSFVSANLAVALAQVGLKTLLIDADLRAPAIPSMIPPRTRQKGLAECLVLPDPHAADFIDADVLPNLSVLYAGASTGNAQELLGRDQFERLIKECLREYDVTIVDTPPANSSADARRIGALVGYAAVVAQRNKSLVSDVKTLIAQLTDDHAVVIGTVYNAQ